MAAPAGRARRWRSGQHPRAPPPKRMTSTPTQRGSSAQNRNGALSLRGRAQAAGKLAAAAGEAHCMHRSEAEPASSLPPSWCPSRPRCCVPRGSPWSRRRAIAGEDRAHPDVKHEHLTDFLTDHSRNGIEEIRLNFLWKWRDKLNFNGIKRIS